ncbi:MAG: Na+/H+ antiporter subunit A, partial [Cellulomonadaceae bacterium]|nr:Na+/H+ antiporter subunit A [Cellulomonadaceae bacterium]
DNILLLFVFWELTTVFSYLLIGHYMSRKASRRAAMQAIIVTTAGGLTMLVGFVMLGTAAGTWSLRGIIDLVIARGVGGPIIVVAALCVLAGAATKAALIPTHFWLPAAMAAPTPVSAYLHAAAMVKAGVYVVARFAPAFADIPGWRPVVLVLGAGTMLLGGYRALRQYDLKLVLAFGTISQLGLIVLLVGYGSRGAALAGLALLGAHAMFKAALFLVVGAVDARTGSRDLRRLSGLWRDMPWMALCGLLAAGSMIGLPPFAGYIAKEAALEAWIHDPDLLGKAALAALTVGSVLTVAYGCRFLWGAFGVKSDSQRDLWVHAQAARDTQAGHASDPLTLAVARPGRKQAALIAPPLLLALGGLALAAIPGMAERMLTTYAGRYPIGHDGHLTLWGGFTPALAITAGVLVAGGLAFALRVKIERWQARSWHPVSADYHYRRFMRWLDDLAADVTSYTQRGSLPFYLSMIFICLVVGPGLGLLGGLIRRAGTVLPGATPQAAAQAYGSIVRLGPFAVAGWERGGEIPIVLVAIAAALLATRARRRLKAVLLVGVTGYGCALIFLLYGAPDLALTQVLAETLTLVVLVLVLRSLPPYFSNRPYKRSRYGRIAIGAAVGGVAMLFAVAAPLARVEPSIAHDFIEAALAGGGRNIVNVALVDMRAWDTVGEISVLLVAATGVASLVFLRQRGKRAPRISDHAHADRGHRAVKRGRWISAAPLIAADRRSVLFEVSTRTIFHAMIVFAMFLMMRGHNNPGGGFAAGLMVGLAITVRYFAGGRYELGEAAPVHPGVVLGIGLFISAAVGLIPLVAGRYAIESTILDLHLPLFGDVHLATSLFFDVGVFFVVVGLVLDILRSLGGEIDRHGERLARRATGRRAARARQATLTSILPEPAASVEGSAHGDAVHSQGMHSQDMHGQGVRGQAQPFEGGEKA